jgi:hypothetical protein
VFDSSKVARGEEERPGQIRSHVFDYNEDELGIRFVISREDDPELGIVIHFSASMGKESKLLKSATIGGLTIPHLEDIAVMIFQTISGDYREPRLIAISQGSGVPHWVIQDQYAAGAMVSDKEEN